MRKYCTDCGESLSRDYQCPKCASKNPSGTGTHSTVTSTQDLIDDGPLVNLPPAKIARRLGGSGIEFAIYCLVAVLLFAVSLPTAGTADLVITPLLLLIILLRDTNSGAFSIAKRIGSMRVVNQTTGLPISNYQALLRNSYYLVVTAFFIIPLLNFVPLTLLFLLISIDVLLIIFSAKSTRLGDWLAGTQVVQVKQRQSIRPTSRSRRKVHTENSADIKGT